MEGLQRSQVSFRRQGSSGLVWDDKFLSGELTQLANQQKEDNKNKKPNKAAAARPAGLTIERSRSNNGGRANFRTDRRAAAAALEPPSPKVSACGLCGGFGKNKNTRRRPPKSGNRVV